MGVIGMVEWGRGVFCWRGLNLIYHLYLALPRNVLSIQETLGGKEGVCLLFCYLTGLLMGQPTRYPLGIWGKTRRRSFCVRISAEKSSFVDVTTKTLKERFNPS